MGLLLAAVLTLASPAQDIETEHFALVSPGNVVPAKDFTTLLEAFHALWSTKLGAAGAPAGKLKIALYFDAKEFTRHGSLEYRYSLKEGTLHLYCDEDLLSSLAAGGTQLYLSAAYPALAGRKDVAPWLFAGLKNYFGGCRWDQGVLQVDSIRLPDPTSNALTLQFLLKKGDWWTLDKALRAQDTEIEARRLHFDLVWWAAFWVLFNGSDEGGGKGKAAAAVPEFLAALNAGQKVEEAFKVFQKPAGIAGPSALDKMTREYIQKLKVETQDREPPGWLVAETAHYTIEVSQRATDPRTKTGPAQLLQELKWKMELMYERYHLAFRLQRRPQKKATLRIYADAMDYRTSGAPPDSAAFYNPRTKALVGYPTSTPDVSLFQVLCHEGTHQFFDLAFPGFFESDALPMWLSEGFAECLASVEIRGKDIYVFQLKGAGGSHIRMQKDAVQKYGLGSLSALVEMDHKTFMAGGYQNYGRAWSFVHFLWNSPSLDSGKGTYSEVVVRLIEGFKAGRPKEEVYRYAFQLRGKPLRFDALEREWHSYADKLHVRD